MDFAEKENQKFNKKVISSKKKETPEPVWFNKVSEKEELTSEEKEELENLFKEFK